MEPSPVNSTEDIVNEIGDSGDTSTDNLSNLMLDNGSEEEFFSNLQVYRQLLAEKNGDPSQFQSFWEFDEQDIEHLTMEEIEADPIEYLLWAAEHNNMEKVKELLEKNIVSINCKDTDGYSPLHRAAYENHIQMAAYLLDNNAQLESQTGDGWTPLHSASRWNNHDMVQFLLSRGANVNAQTKGGLTPLHVACAEPNTLETIKVLLDSPSINLALRNCNYETSREICRRSNGNYHLFTEFDEKGKKPQTNIPSTSKVDASKNDDIIWKE